MSRKPTLLALVVAVACGALWFAQSVPARAGDTLDEAAGSSLQQFAGTYWLVFNFGGQSLPAIVQIGSDGTVISVDGADQGIVGLSDPGSAQLGTAWRTGPRQVTGRNMSIDYDPVTGVPTYANVNTFVSDYDPASASGEGVLQGREYDLAAGENPLDPNQGTPGDPIPYAFWRLEQP